MSSGGIVLLSKIYGAIVASCVEELFHWALGGRTWLWRGVAGPSVILAVPTSESRSGVLARSGCTKTVLVSIMTFFFFFLNVV